jgi:Na+-translocating ferredoxin:NAD+ oxidoreductase RnfD subunit
LLWVLMLGLLVTARALRSDVSLSFLAFYALLKAGRVLYLGQMPAVLVHQLAVGSLLIFAFFMISDPKTTPRTLGGRVALAGAVALTGFLLQTVYWVQGALIFALLLLSPLPPLIDWARGRIAVLRNPRSPPCAVTLPLSS